MFIIAWIWRTNKDYIYGDEAKVLWTATRALTAR